MKTAWRTSPAGLALRAAIRADGRQAFTLIEIAISVAIVAFALVAIIGVLPSGLNVQRDNREETIIAQDAAFIIQALRSGATNLEIFTRNIDMIQISNRTATQTTTPDPYNGMPNPLLGTNRQNYTVATPEMMLSFLTTPKHMRLQPGQELTNYVTARIRAFSGPLADKGETDTARQLTFTYLLFCDVVPFDPFPQSEILLDNSRYAPNMSPLDRLSRVYSNNLYEVRLEFRWPVLSDPANNNGRPDKPVTLGRPGNGRMVYRTLIAGSITNYPSTINPAYTITRFVPQVVFNPLPPPAP